MSGNLVQMALDAAFIDYVTKMFAVRISSIRAADGDSHQINQARKAFANSLTIATAEHILASGEVAPSDKTKSAL